MRVLVCGGRDFNDYDLLKRILDAYTDITEIIHGAARGADTLGGRYGRETGIDVTEFPADWRAFGKGAGHIRNRQMLEYGVDLVLAFPGGRGTQNMIDQSIKAGVETRIIEI